MAKWQVVMGLDGATNQTVLHECESPNDAVVKRIAEINIRAQELPSCAAWFYKNIIVKVSENA